MEERNEPRESYAGRGVTPPWRRRSVLVAAAIMVVGLALWAAAWLTAPAPAAAAQGAAADRSLVHGYAPDTGTSGVAPASPPQRRFIDRASPAMARLGFSFIVGFCVAYAFRRFLKMAALLAGLVFVGLFALQKTGVIQADWDAIRGHVEESLAWMRGQADSLKTFATGYLPSAASAAVGGFFGFRRG